MEMKFKQDLEKKLRIGDVVSISFESVGSRWKTRTFSGILISRTGVYPSTRFLLRNIVHNVPLEFSFFIYSHTILNIKKLPVTKIAKVKEAKLYKLRGSSLNKSLIKF